MSKFCCGIEYPDDQKFCRMCGKILTDDDVELDKSEKSSTDDVNSAESETSYERPLEKMSDDMTELMADDENVKYTDDELEDMDVQRMAHHIMNDENRTDMELLGEIFSDDAFTLKEKKREAKRLKKLQKKEKANEGTNSFIRFLGVMGIILALLGILLVCATVYFLMYAPTYNKNSYLNGNYTFSDSASLSDADYTQMKEGYYLPGDATATDAEVETEVTETDTEEATETDATDVTDETATAGDATDGGDVIE